MKRAWVAGAIAAALPPATATPDSLDAVPAVCERLQGVLADVAANGAYLSRDRLEALATEPCRKAIDAGQWPGLVRELSAEKSMTLRSALCALAPPGAIPIATRWLVAREPTGDDAGCARMVLRGDPDAFRTIASERFVSPGDPPSTDPIVWDLARQMTPEERVWLLPALELATKNQEPGRDDLYAEVCSTAAARSAHACAEYPPKLVPVWSRRATWKRVAPWYAAHGFAALTYAVWGIVANRRRGREVTWRLPGIGAAAVFVAAEWLIVVAPPHGEGALSVLDYALAAVLTLPAIVAGFAAAWAAVRFRQASPIFLCVAEALTYVALIVAYGSRHW